MDIWDKLIEEAKKQYAPEEISPFITATASKSSPPGFPAFSCGITCRCRYSQETRRWRASPRQKSAS